MARQKKQKVENIEPEVQEQVKEVETPKEEATEEEGKTEPDDAVKEMNRTFLKNVGANNLRYFGSRRAG
jgi:hypothetical protein